MRVALEVESPGQPPGLRVLAERAATASFALLALSSLLMHTGEWLGVGWVCGAGALLFLVSLVGIVGGTALAKILLAVERSRRNG